MNPIEVLARFVDAAAVGWLTLRGAITEQEAPRLPPAADDVDALIAPGKRPQGQERGRIWT